MMRVLPGECSEEAYEVEILLADDSDANDRKSGLVLLPLLDIILEHIYSLLYRQSKD